MKSDTNKNKRNHKTKINSKKRNKRHHKGGNWFWSSKKTKPVYHQDPKKKLIEIKEKSKDLIYQYRIDTQLTKNEIIKKNLTIIMELEPLYTKLTNELIKKTDKKTTEYQGLKQNKKLTKIITSTEMKTIDTLCDTQRTTMGTNYGNNYPSNDDLAKEIKKKFIETTGENKVLPTETKPATSSSYFSSGRRNHTSYNRQPQQSYRSQNYRNGTQNRRY